MSGFQGDAFGSGAPSGSETNEPEQPKQPTSAAATATFSPFGPLPFTPNETAMGLPPRRPPFNHPALQGGVTEPPLPLRAASALQAEWMRTVSDLRTLTERAEQTLIELQKATPEPDRLGIGGNSPPEPIHETVGDMLRAIKVVRLETEKSEPSWPVLDLALSVLKRGLKTLGAWAALMWNQFSSAAAATAGKIAAIATAAELAKQAGLEIGALVEILERLFKIVGGSP